MTTSNTPTSNTNPTEELHDILQDLWITAYEGGSSYWAETRLKWTAEQRAKFADQSPSELVFDWMWNQDLAIAIYDCETDELLGALTREKMIAGLELMKTECPTDWHDVHQEAWDASTADMWLQLSLLQEIVYG